MSSCSDAELTDAALPPDRLLYGCSTSRAYAFSRTRYLQAKCRCSRERVERVLRALPPAELDDMVVDGRISVTCEFCNTQYEFDDEDRAKLTVVS